MDLTIEAKNSDLSNNISRTSSFNRFKMENNLECSSSKHYNGANQRQNMFCLNEELRMISNLKGKDENDIIQDPSILSNSRNVNEIDTSQMYVDGVKDKSQINVLYEQNKDYSFRNQLQNKYTSLQIHTIKKNELIKQTQTVQDIASQEIIGENMQNTYDLQEKESRRLENTEQSPIQKQTLINNSKFQHITLFTEKQKARESLKELPKSVRSSSRITPPGLNFFTRMKVSQFTRKFMNKIKSLSSKYNLRQLTKKHYDIINDKSAFFVEKKAEENIGQRQKIIQLFVAFMLNIKEKLDSVQPLNPESRFCVICDLIYGITLLAYLFIVPIQLSFNISFDLFELVVFIILVVNFFLTLNKSYYFKGRMITSRKLILLNFVKYYLIFDLIVFFSIRLQMFQYVAFLKFFEINNIIKRADNHFQIIRKFPITFTLVNLLFKMCLIAQIAGCTFHYVARLEIEENLTSNSWLSAQHMTDAPWGSRYIICIYFAFITMMTVGYGDVVPVTNYERIYVIFMTLLSSAIFGYVVNTIGQLYNQQAQKQEQFSKRKQEINLFMDDRKIDSNTKIKVLNYLEYAFQYQKKKDQNPQILFQDLPQTLVEEICIKYYGRYLFQNKIMKLNFSENVLKALSNCMKEKNLAPNEYLFHKGNSEQLVYFLVSGKIDIVFEGKEAQIAACIDQISKEGDEIGLRSAFIGSERSNSAKCQKNQNCTVVFFEMDDFKKILQNYPKDYERYCEIKDDIIFNSNTLDTKCASCQKYDHITYSCPLISLNIQKGIFLHKYNSGGEPQIRKQHSTQRRGKQINCLIQNELIRQKLKQYRMSLVFMIIPELRENEQNFQDRSDKFFFNKMPTVKIMDGGDMEAEIEEYNIYDGYETMVHDDQCVEDEEESDNIQNKKQEEDHYLAIQNESGDNMIGSSSYSSSLQQLQPQQLQQVQIQITASSSKENIMNINQGQQQVQFQSQPITSQQKVSLFAKKTSQNIEVPLNDASPQVNLSQINQASSRNLSFRRERGDSFYPPTKRNSKQLSQQRSLQSRVKSSRKNSEIIQNSSKPSNQQVGFYHETYQDIVESNQAQTELFIYDFDRLKLFEKYFPYYNYNNVLLRLNKKKPVFKPKKKIHKTIVLTSPKKRQSKKIQDMERLAQFKI
ncbi:cyclic nucleotide-binding domain protein (macronuclear) [Tetrahymena thermophila SB210]|uniref:Cyclic nucleotide-binding domain protein n=1 Tax=Tetrahymena thermophila (strain SB210) TaxID=312017 RepID=I7MAP2_TETTS|nr:cyclic nucleotide-binding domain protein [Tetrahymena thermophila SB210]EAS04978.2 cyclic nucleotide-binding domain protein [Tetrahymena thermophila SB210]|eukprot:XP_001025223.2 cyclic nucleotide-binding domain protein [Tetrahymena thermophila SB210]